MVRAHAGSGRAFCRAPHLRNAGRPRRVCRMVLPRRIALGGSRAADRRTAFSPRCVRGRDATSRLHGGRHHRSRGDARCSDRIYVGTRLPSSGECRGCADRRAAGRKIGAPSLARAPRKHGDACRGPVCAARARGAAADSRGRVRPLRRDSTTRTVDGGSALFGAQLRWLCAPSRCW